MALESDSPTDVLLVARPDPDGSTRLHSFKTGKIVSIFRPRTTPLGQVVMIFFVVLGLLAIFAYMSWQIGRWHGRQETATR